MTRRGARSPRQRRARGRSRVGERFTADVGPIAHGGHCVVRLPVDTSVEPVETRVVFVRHAIPGERVVVEITEGTEGDRFWRGDAVEVLDPSPDRVPAPCPVAGPGLCGGCDFQHVDLARQRALKADVVREQLARLAGLDLDVVVESVPGDVDGLRWRTRQRYVELPDGRRGMRKHRSHDVVPVDDCLLEAPGPASHAVLGHEFSVGDDGFWQVHPGAAQVLVETVLENLAPRPGESVLDLYAGVGLFARFLADAVGPAARIVAVEGNPTAGEHAGVNLGDRAEVAVGSVDRVLAAAYDEPFDLVVLDPPREGAKRAVVAQVVARAPRAVAYVACDPAALARDVAIFAEHGYRLDRLRALDLFPMTHHVEGVALLVPRRRVPAPWVAGEDAHMASYTVNPAGVEQATKMIDARQYVLDSDWGEVQPNAAIENAYLEKHSWDEYAAWHLGLTEGPSDETKARYAFVFGDFRRVHRTALIACVYRASEWRHKDVELAAHDLLQHLDRASGLT